MNRIAYFENELAQNYGYEYDMCLLSMMTDVEKVICFGLNSISEVEEVPQIIADYYEMMAS